MISEEKMFENFDGQTTVTGILMAHLGAFGSGELKSMQKSAMTDFVSGQAEEILINLRILQFIFV